MCVFWINFVLRYRVAVRDFLENWGGPLLRKYGRSPFKILSSIYTDYEFLPWLFNRSPRSYFELRENRMKYADWLIEKVGVKSDGIIKNAEAVTNRTFMQQGSPINNQYCESCKIKIHRNLLKKLKSAKKVL